jgi:tetratricopeptide (TPR) repeat protein
LEKRVGLTWRPILVLSTGKHGGDAVQFLVCVLLICFGSYALCASPEAPSEASAIYRRAADAISNNDVQTATQLLEQLTQENPDSPLSEIAAFHLAECYQIRSQTQRALELLATWGRRIDESTTIEQLAPATKSKTRQLLTRLLEDLKDEPATLAVLEHHCDGVAKLLPEQGLDWFGAQISLELASRYEQHQQYEQADRCLRRLVETGIDVPQYLQTKLNLELPLAWGQHTIAQGQPRVAVQILKRALESNRLAEQELALRFLLAEALFAAGDRDAAAEQFQWLTAQAESQAAKPSWLASIMLRQAELLIRSRQFVEARELLLQAQTQHADLEASYEFDYLLARCALARIEFDEATSRLQRVVEAPAAAGKEPQARAGWMLGEILFLQRKYLPAIAAYDQVAQMDAFPEWQARALLQSAKCHELLGDVSAALKDYQQASELSQHPDIARTASQRTAILQSATINLR